MNITDEQREELRLLISYVDEHHAARRRCEAIVDTRRLELEKAQHDLIDAGNRLVEANRNLHDFINDLTYEGPTP
jgi:hypothetical protein